jgi:putative transposase
VLNRANARLPLLQKDADYEAFERVLTEAQERVAVRILAYCVLSNHWHLVVWPEHDGQLSRFVNWLTLTHTQRWHANRHNAGTGHLYQGRFKSFVVQEDEHFLRLCRYVERNALRAGLVLRAQEWGWCSLGRREYGDRAAKALLGSWPVPRPAHWVDHVNLPQSEAELGTLRECVRRSRPYGLPEWVEATAGQLGLETTLRPRGRPKKSPEDAQKGS